MGAVIEDIAGRGIDWDGASICRRVWLLPVEENQSLVQVISRHEASNPACNCSVSNFCCGASEPILGVEVPRMLW